MRGIHTRPGRSTRARRAMAVASAGLMAVAAFVVGPRSVLADTETLTLEASPPSGTVGADIPDLGATATLTGADSPSNAVSFTLYSDSNCQSAATPTASGSGTLSANGDGSYSASYSQDWTPTAVGTYYWQATYQDSDGPVVSDCTETSAQVMVGQASTSISTAVFDAGTSSPWAGGETTGASAYDTSMVTGVAGVTPTGTVSYTFWADTNCANTGSDAGTNLSLGSASSTQGPLAAGSYSFEAVYSGDSNYIGSTSSCESFTVGAGTADVSTAVDDAGTNTHGAVTRPRVRRRTTHRP